MLDLEVAVVIGGQLLRERLAARIVAGRDEHAGRWQRASLASLDIAQAHACHPVLADDLGTSLSQANRIFGFAMARSCMIFDARSVSRRCTIVTLLAKRVRKVASSIAESPPPITTMSCSRTKKLSHVAHQETPCPDSGFSPGATGLSGQPTIRRALPGSTSFVLALARCGALHVEPGRGTGAARLGHADPAVTLRIYSHVLREHALGVGEIFAEAVKATVSKSVSTPQQQG